MIREFKTDIGLEFYIDGELEFSFEGNYYAYYQEEYDNLTIRSNNDNLTVFRYEQASQILFDGVLFSDIQNQLNHRLNNLKGAGSTGGASELTLVGLVNLLTGLGKYFGPVVTPSRGTLSITNTSQVVLSTVGSKSGTLRNATNGIVYISFGAAATTNSALALIPDAYYEIPPFFIGLSCNAIGTGSYTGVLSYTNNEG